jgi:hypothetical protein
MAAVFYSGNDGFENVFTKEKNKDFIFSPILAVITPYERGLLFGNN